MEDIQYRLAGRDGFTFLAGMLGEAAVWRPDKPTPTADQVLADLRYSMYLAGAGPTVQVSHLVERYRRALEILTDQARESPTFGP